MAGPSLDPAEQKGRKQPCHLESTAAGGSVRSEAKDRCEPRRGGKATARSGTLTGRQACSCSGWSAA